MNPLKQGLKRVSSKGFEVLNDSVKVVNPLKQGLKQSLTGKLLPFSTVVKVVNPLKQGLKLRKRWEIYRKGTGCNVKVVNPLKQGLKPSSYIIEAGC